MEDYEYMASSSVCRQMRIWPAFMASLIKHLNKAVRKNYMAMNPLLCTDPQCSAHNEGLYITLTCCVIFHDKKLPLWLILKHEDKFYSKWCAVYKHGMSFWCCSVYQFLKCKLCVLFTFKYLHAWSIDLMSFNLSTSRGWKI